MLREEFLDKNISVELSDMYNLESALYQFDTDEFLDVLSRNSSDGDGNWFMIPDTSSEKKIEYALVMCIAVIGIIGNSLSFFLLTRVTFRRFSYAAYLRYLAVFDTINLFIEIVLKVDELCMSRLQWSLMSYHNEVSCKLWEYSRHTCVLLSSWLVAVFSLDRLVAVTCPLFKFKFCTVRWARLATFALCILCAASQVFRLIFITSLPGSPQHNINPCFPSPQYKEMYFVANSFFSKFGMRFLIPFVIIATSNCFVLRILRHHSPSRPTPALSRFIPTRSNARQTRLAQSALYLVCAYFVLTMLPSASLEMVWYVYQSQGQLERYVKLLPYQAPFNLLRLTNYAINFFLYCASFRSFRHELNLMRYRIRGIKLCSPAQSVNTSETNLADRSSKSSSRQNS